MTIFLSKGNILLPSLGYDCLLSLAPSVVPTVSSSPTFVLSSLKS